MASERTFSIIKPDATGRNLTGKVNAMIEAAGLRIVAQKRVRWTKAQAETFYEVHKARPFYPDLVAFMTSGPIVVQVLEATDAVKKYRAVMGATDPVKADKGTIRKELAESIERNSVHGSDSSENAALEIGLNFAGYEIVGWGASILQLARDDLTRRRAEIRALRGLIGVVAELDVLRHIAALAVRDAVAPGAMECDDLVFGSALDVGHLAPARLSVRAAVAVPVDGVEPEVALACLRVDLQFAFQEHVSGSGRNVPRRSTA